MASISALQRLEQDLGGRLHTLADCDATREKVVTDPAALTPLDFALLEYFGSAKDVAHARAAHANATGTAPAAPVVAAPESLIGLLTRGTALVISACRPHRDPNFDRARAAAQIAATLAEEPPIQPGRYDRGLYVLARQQAEADPSKLTDQDLEQLTLVDRRDGERARAARAGFVSADHDADDAGGDLPASLLAVSKLIGLFQRHISHWIHTIQFRVREAHVRLDVLEKRFVDPKDAAFELSRMAATVKTLSARLEAIEARPSMVYEGVFKAGTMYARGAMVTFGGSCWYAKERTGATPGAGPTPWVLAVKSGRDGKDLR